MTEEFDELLVKEVKDYLSSYGLPRQPERISFEFSIHEDSENDNL